MKLEAVDRKNPTMTCVATITDMKNGRLLIHFDGWTNTYDYWCEPTTPDIHPRGWCQNNGVHLHAPHGKTQFTERKHMLYYFCGYIFTIYAGYHKTFTWDQYLAETGSVAAPKSYFKQVGFMKGLYPIFFFVFFYIIGTRSPRHVYRHFAHVWRPRVIRGRLQLVRLGY